jgi:hypothetical protein
MIVPMTVRMTLAALVVALAGTARADLPAEGVYVASQTSFGSTGWDEHFYIHRVRPGGIALIAEIRTNIGSEFGWSDAHTLWRTEYTGDGLTVQRLVDGKLTETIRVANTDWHAAGIDPQLLEVPMLLITRGGAVWLEQCLKRKTVSAGQGPCSKALYAPVDGKPLQVVTRPPADIDGYRVDAIFPRGRPRAFPRVAAPAGYSIRLGKVTVRRAGEPARMVAGAVCNGPAGQTVTWPDAMIDIDFAMRPAKVTWMRTSPPLAEISGDATNPIGEVVHHRAYLFDCKEAVDNAEQLTEDLWGVLRDIPLSEWQKSKAAKSDGTWTIYSGDQVIGTVPGSEIRFAPR